MKNGYKCLTPIFVIMASLLVPTVLLADTTGSILGLVRDQSQAVLK